MPCYLVVSVVYTYVALACYNTEVLTKSASELCTVTDTHAKIVKYDADTGLVKGVEKQSIINNNDNMNHTSNRSKRRDSSDSNNSSEDSIAKGGYKLYQQQYLFSPTDGVWDLPLAEVNKLLYADSNDDGNLRQVY